MVEDGDSVVVAGKGVDGFELSLSDKPSNSRICMGGFGNKQSRSKLFAAANGDSKSENK